MKIGAVCEQTGLTDRTVRYYTEEGLLSPSYTKNYLGRKTFDFTEADVAMLKHIAVLRKYGFSIPEIKSILEDPAKSVEIIESLRQKKRETIQSEQELLDVLLTLEKGKPYTVPELAEALNTPKLDNKKLPDDEEDCCLTTFCKILFWVMCVPALFLCFFLVLSFLIDCPGRYPHVKRAAWFATWMWGVVGVFLIPTSAVGIMIALERARGRMDSTVRQFITIVVFLCYALFGNIGFAISFISSCMIGIYSETEDPRNYLIVGTMEKEKLGEDLTLMFPDQVPEYALGEQGSPSPDTTRYYNYADENWDTRVELYAQWVLTEEDFAAERSRIQDVFSQKITNQGHIGNWEYWSIHQDPSSCITDERKYQSGHFYLFFACDEATGTVRYVASYASAGFYVPAFCSLDWN